MNADSDLEVLTAVGLGDVLVAELCAAAPDKTRIEQILERGPVVADLTVQQTAMLARTALRRSWTSALLVAADQQWYEVLRLLLDGGIAVDAVDMEGQTALIYLASRTADQSDWRCAKALIEKNADLEKRGVDGKTALIYAIENKNLALVNVLIESGANVNAQDNGGDMAGLYALLTVDIDLIARVFATDIDMTLRNANKHTVLDFLPNEDESPEANLIRHIVLAAGTAQQQKTLAENVSRLQNGTDAPIALRPPPRLKALMR